MSRHLRFVKTYDANEMAVTPRFELWEDNAMVASYTGEGYNFSIIQGLLLGAWYQEEYGEMLGHAFDFPTMRLQLAGSGCQLIELNTRKSGGEVTYAYAIQQDYPTMIDSDEYEETYGNDEEDGNG